MHALCAIVDDNYLYPNSNLGISFRIPEGAIFSHTKKKIKGDRILLTV
jgi:hypothetical protein